VQQVSNITTVFFDQLSFQVPNGVYQPREDSRLAADVLTDMDVEGKTVLDIGTGCGFLAIIAARDGASVDAVDINDRALQAARENAERNNVQLTVYQSDLFSQVNGTYDLILFNAPYLPDDREGDKEQLAWAGGEDGRELIDTVLSESSNYLRDSGRLLIVQSSVTGIEATRSKMRENGLEPAIRDRENVPWEQLLVVEGWKI
jgi:release factor glutamine methyltransferase